MSNFTPDNIKSLVSGIKKSVDDDLINKLNYKIINSAIDFNTLTQGLYSIRVTGNTNSPVNDMGMLIIDGDNTSGNISQLYFVGGSSSNIYKRYYNGSTWSTWVNINKSSSSGSSGGGSSTIYYAKCNTASNERAKVATTNSGDFQLIDGALVYVAFINPDTINYSTPMRTLNIDGTGDKDIYVDHIDPPGDKLGYSQLFIYDATDDVYRLAIGWNYNWCEGRWDWYYEGSSNDYSFNFTGLDELAQAVIELKEQVESGSGSGGTSSGGSSGGSSSSDSSISAKSYKDVDMNSVTDVGIHAVNASSNKPEGESFYTVIVGYSTPNSSSYIHQIAITENSCNMYVRFYNSGSWGSWQSIGSGGGSSSSGDIVVDSVLSATSTNPVQNKVIYAALDDKAPAGEGCYAFNSNGFRGIDEVTTSLNDLLELFAVMSSTKSATLTVTDTIETTFLDPINDSSIGNINNAWNRIYGDNIYYKTSCSKSSDYAICREWLDGNPNNEDRIGKFVVQDGKYIRLATSKDTNIKIIGVISGNYCILENAAPTEWKDKYLKDIYGRIKTQMVHHPEITKIKKVLSEDEDGNKVFEEKEVVVSEAYDAEEPIINPEWDETQEYIPRMDRPEYDAVGVVGILVVDDDGTCQVGGFCMPNDDSIATASEDGFYVEERIDDSHIKISIR